MNSDWKVGDCVKYVDHGWDIFIEKVNIIKIKYAGDGSKVYLVRRIRDKSDIFDIYISKLYPYTMSDEEIIQEYLSTSTVKPLALAMGI